MNSHRIFKGFIPPDGYRFIGSAESAYNGIYDVECYLNTRENMLYAAYDSTMGNKDVRIFKVHDSNANLDLNFRDWFFAIFNVPRNEDMI